MAELPPPAPGRRPDRPKRTTNRDQYGEQHRRLRRQRIAQNPVCEVCGVAFSTQAHHVHYPARDVNDYVAVCGDKCHRYLDEIRRARG